MDELLEQPPTSEQVDVLKELVAICTASNGTIPTSQKVTDDKPWVNEEFLALLEKKTYI